MRLEIGRVVRCIAGKEQDGFYIVTGLEDGFVLLADGKHRPLGKPKRKNVKHIRSTDTVWEVGGLTDRALRKRLCAYADKGGN